MIKVVASTLAILAVSAAVADAQKWYEPNYFVEAAAECPRYSARSTQCDNSGNCKTRGKGCVVDCRDNRKERGDCSNVTLGTADICMLAEQAADSKSTGCTFKCSSITDPDACYSIGDGTCYWYEGSCRNGCSELRDAAACGTNTATCGAFNKDLRSSECPYKCELFTDAYSCNAWANDCRWNVKTLKCEFDCNAARDKAAQCALHPQCEMTYGQCSFKCSAIMDKKQCHESSCMWALNKCTIRCSAGQIPPPYNWTMRQANCHDISPVCGGVYYCQAVNCSLALSKWECEKGIGNCYWFGTSETQGQCATTCNVEWSQPKDQGNPTCTAMHGGQNTCNLVNQTTCYCYSNGVPGCCSTQKYCADNDCGNITEMNACFTYWKGCQWDRSTSTCLKACTSLSGSSGKLDEQSECQKKATANKCVHIPYSSADPNNGQCLPTCADYLKDACMLVKACIWANGACAANCDYLSETSCKASTACVWVNDTLNKAKCKVKCSLGDQDTCKTLAFSSSECVWVGGDACSCIRHCPKNAVGECPSPCVRSAKWGACMIPEGYVYTETCSSVGLSAAAVGGIVGGVVGFIVIAIIVGVIVVMVVGKKAADAASGDNSAQPMTAAAQQPGMGYQQPGMQMQQPGMQMQQPGMGYQQPGMQMQQPVYAQPGGFAPQPGYALAPQPGYAAPIEL